MSLDFGGTRESFDDVLSGLIGESGNDPEAVLALFADHLATAVVSCDSPRFLAFIPAAPTKAALLFDMIVSCSSLQGTSWLEAAGAVAAENQVLEFLAALAGLPPGAGGCFVSGGSIANLSALVVARDTAVLRRDGGAAPTAHRRERGGPRLGRQGAADPGRRALRGARRSTTASPATRCAAALDARRPIADDVIGVVATAGTTNAGIVDDLAGIADGGARARACGSTSTPPTAAPGCSPRSSGTGTPGIEHADSFVIDPHKWLYAPFDCAALVYRQPALAKAVHSQEASYLDVIHDEDNPVWNPSDYAVHLTRRARGLPLWFSLAVHGAGAYRDAVETVLRTAWRSAELIDARRRTSSWCASPSCRSCSSAARAGARPTTTTGRCASWPSRSASSRPTTWEGETVARLAFLHPGTTLAMVEEIVATMA